MKTLQHQKSFQCNQAQTGVTFEWNGADAQQPKVGLRKCSGRKEPSCPVWANGVTPDWKECDFFRSLRGSG